MPEDSAAKTWWTTPVEDFAGSARILARSFYRHLRSCGYTPRHLLAISSELIELVIRDLRRPGPV